jgi:hypothetical protein
MPALALHRPPLIEKHIDVVYAGNLVAKDWLEANHKLKWQK